MTRYFEADLDRYSAVLADNLREVATELRAIDVVDLVSYVRFGSLATLDDLVQSATELFFRSGTISFAWTARVDLGWEQPPAVTLGLEFRYQAISVFFDLALHAAEHSVSICGVLFDEPPDAAADRTRLLMRAIAAARLPGSAIEAVHGPGGRRRLA